ncbi:MAG: endolytic transglycosylase MltG, partial [Treponema sp.]|nr:endolytic transglycosylase MltG [Treponema sp.]
PVKSGSYLIEIPANQIAIHRILVSGRQLLMRVTVPEGLTLKKTAALLEDAGICPAGEFLEASYDSAIINRYRIPGASMEGYLYPDTYLFPPQYPAEKVVQAMADNFFIHIEEIDERALSMPPDELNRLVILASIVEREYRLDEEAPVMAGVFFNRLDIGMALQSCATVEYVITEIQGRPHPEILLTRDTEIRNPYNTYIRPGLPPGPISAPGHVALGAVFAPSKNDYLYFRLVDPAAGRHYFSGTLDDHIRAGALYVKGGS